MNGTFSAKKLVKVNARNITWRLLYWKPYDVAGYLPSNVSGFEVEVDEDVDPFEKWREDNYQTGYEALCDALANQLSNDYGFKVICIDDVEVIE